MKQTGHEQRGMTLIDTVVGSALMLAVFMGIAAVFQLSVDVVTNNRARAGAIALMNERMEYVRGLDYISVGTVGGIPAGPILQSESVTLSGISYTRRTTIQYADDPEDGEGEADENDIIVDYKQVRIELLWSSRMGERRVVIVARVEPLNGEEVACDSPCGTIRVDALNAASEPVSNARVSIMNGTVVPAVDIVTYTNVNGRVILAGAPVASGYEVSVSKSGYNSAQTYASGAGNPNPTPAHASVLQNQTTPVTFALPDSGVDYLSTKTVRTFSAITSETWNEPFSDTSRIASSTNVAVTGGSARLPDPGAYPEWGELESVAIEHDYLARWREFSWSGAASEGTAVVFRFLNAAGALIPDADLPGNAAGFTSSVDLYALSTSTYPAIAVRATLTSEDPNTTPSVDSYAILYDYGPVPLGNAHFDMRGSKRIGTDPIIYKYDEEDLQTNATGVLTLSNMEWDTYDITIPAGGYDLAYSCAPQPEYLAPASAQTTLLYLAPHTSNSLRFLVENGSGAAVPGATVAISRLGFHATSTTGSCGQTFFAGLVAGSYGYRVTANGYIDNSATLPVTGLTEKTVELMPQ